MSPYIINIIVIQIFIKLISNELNTNKFSAQDFEIVFHTYTVVPSTPFRGLKISSRHAFETTFHSKKLSGEMPTGYMALFETKLPTPTAVWNGKHGGQQLKECNIWQKLLLGIPDLIRSFWDV